MPSSPSDISHWFAQIAAEDEHAFDPRPALSEDRSADVCIVGAGYTGLWTAYSLLRADPSLDVVLLDAEMAGYGASGRNGGAVIAQLNGSREYWAGRGGGLEGAAAMERAVRDSVDEIGEAVEREGIECSFSKNGVVMVARTDLEAERFRASVEADREMGFGPEHSAYLDAEEVLERINVEGAIGARFSPHCASIHPGRLVRGLADVVEGLGATIYEQSRVTEIATGSATAGGHTVQARFVVRATEAYTDSIRGQERAIVPVHTSMLVTEPIPSDVLEQIGWAGREALLAEHPFLHLQHTADGRITIGGDDNRVPYRYGSAPCPDGRAPDRVAHMYRDELVKLFPALADVGIERSWQGIFGAPRDWAPRVGVDESTGFAWAGGFVGEGVAPSNLAGRTLADLILGRETELTRLPLVGEWSGRWEPEPLRFAGAGMIWGMRAIGDTLEPRYPWAGRLTDVGNKLAGFGGHLG